MSLLTEKEEFDLRKWAWDQAESRTYFELAKDQSMVSSIIIEANKLLGWLLAGLNKDAAPITAPVVAQ